VNISSVHEQDLSRDFATEADSDMESSLPCSVAAMNIGSLVNKIMQEIRERLISFAVEKMGDECHEYGLAFAIVVIDIRTGCDHILDKLKAV
jgi:hypothetical protein